GASSESPQKPCPLAIRMVFISPLIRFRVDDKIQKREYETNENNETARKEKEPGCFPSASLFRWLRVLSYAVCSFATSSSPSSLIICSRSSNFLTLPLAVSGKAARN